MKKISSIVVFILLLYATIQAQETIKDSLEVNYDLEWKQVISDFKYKISDKEIYSFNVGMGCCGGTLIQKDTAFFFKDKSYSEEVVDRMMINLFEPMEAHAFIAFINRDYKLLIKSDLTYVALGSNFMIDGRRRVLVFNRIKGLHLGYLYGDPWPPYCRFVAFSIGEAVINNF